MPARTSDLGALIKQQLERVAELDELIATVRRYRDDGASQDAVYAVLDSVRGELDEAAEDRLLELMDVVVGYCRPELRLWSRYKITWDAHEEQVDSVDGVDRRLDQLHTAFGGGNPTLVTVERSESGDSLSIGLGAIASVLNFVRGDGKPPYYTSSGGTDGEPTVSFMFGGEWSEYPSRAVVALDAARVAMRRFCETGELSEAVGWEEV